MTYLMKLGLLLFLAAPTFVHAQSTRPIVGIFQMDDLANSGQANTFSAMIETAITGTGKFRVMERSRLDELLREQGLAAGGVVTSNTPGRIGGFEGVDYLIYGAITSISATNRSDFGSSLLAGVLGGGNRDCHNTNVRMEADIRIADANTGEVRYATRISETQRSAPVCGGGTQIDAAALLRSAADSIATGLVTTIFPIQIAAVQPDGSFILNYGEGTVAQGDFMNVFERGQEIRDPATGEVIANDETLLGSVQITDVQPRYSKATPVSEFVAPPPIGAVVRAASESEVRRSERERRRNR